jgi:signal peptidase I
MPSASGSSTAAAGGLRRHLVAAALSAVVPGTGQLLLGRKLKAIVFLSVLLCTAIGFWPFRLPRSFPGLILLVWACLLLSLFAVCDALLNRDEKIRFSKWWLLAGIPLIYLGVNIIFTSLLLASGFRALQVGFAGMKPTLSPGDKFIYDAEYYRGNSAHHGELAVMRMQGAYTVKRVVAISGDTIYGKDRQVFLNGELQSEPFIQHAFPVGSNPELDTFGPATVPSGKYFVLGDNRDISLDSRTPDFGLIDAPSIVGKPLYVYRLLGKGQLWRELP